MRLSHAGLQVLKACVDHGSGSFHGYELMQLTGLASGTLYPLLMRFEQEGWLISRWEDVDPPEKGRPRRRLYRISAAGRTALQQSLSALGMRLAT